MNASQIGRCLCIFAVSLLVGCTTTHKQYPTAVPVDSPANVDVGLGTSTSMTFLAEQSGPATVDPETGKTVFTVAWKPQGLEVNNMAPIMVLYYGTGSAANIAGTFSGIGSFLHDVGVTTRKVKYTGSATVTANGVLQHIVTVNRLTGEFTIVPPAQQPPG